MNAVKLLTAVHFLIDGLGKCNFECKENVKNLRRFFFAPAYAELN